MFRNNKDNKNNESNKTDSKNRPATEEELNSFRTWLKSFFRSLVMSFLIFLIFMNFVQISKINGHSMDKTLHTGEIALVNKHLYSDFKYGDIVVAKADYGDGQEQVIKRVIGKPGDALACINGVMYRNGKKLHEPYIKEKMKRESWAVIVPKKKLFLMGDNRNVSADSRAIGPIKYKNIVGKVFLYFG